MLTEAERLRRAASFNEGADRYDRARPRYPADLFDAVWRLAELGVHPDVLEVGCGTGQASVGLVAHGAVLTCVELGQTMARLARKNVPTADVVVGRFEEWECDERQFDLVFASSSWHWIEPGRRYERAAHALRPGGSVAIVHSDHVYPPDYDRTFDRIQDVYASVTGSRREFEEYHLPKPDTYDASDLKHIEEMERTGCFDKPRVERILWSIDRTSDEFIDLLGTFSDNWALEPEVREELFAGIHRVIEGAGSRVTKHYASTVRVARRR